MTKIMSAAMAALLFVLLGVAVRADAVDSYRLALSHTADVPNCKTGSGEARLTCLETALQQQAMEIFKLQMALRDLTEARVRPLGR